MRRILSMVVVIIALPLQALAGGSGIGIPETGGQGAGAASSGADGLPANPALAAGLDGNRLFLDMGALYLAPKYTRAPSATQSYEQVGFTVVNPHPSLGVAWQPDDTPFGLGLSAFVPFGRSATYPVDGPQRFHVSNIHFESIHVAPVAAWAPSPVFSIGAGPTVVYTKISTTQRVDMGITLYQMDPAAEPAPPMEDPFLEGELELEHADGVSIGWTAGAMLQPNDRMRFGLGIVSGVPVRMQGRSTLTPSLDLTIRSNADMTMELQLPPVVNAGARFDVTPDVTVGADFQWMGWSVMDRFKITFENSEIEGTNPEMEALMLMMNANESIAPVLDKSKYIGRYPQNTWNATLMSRFHMKRDWDLQVVAGYDRHAIPDETVNAGNLDFDAYSVGLGVEREINDRWTIYATSTQFFLQPRHVENSDFNPYASEESGLANTDASGDYSAFLHRAAVGFRFNW